MKHSTLPLFILIFLPNCGPSAVEQDGSTSFSGTSMATSEWVDSSSGATGLDTGTDTGDIGTDTGEDVPGGPCWEWGQQLDEFYAEYQLSLIPCLDTCPDRTIDECGYYACAQECYRVGQADELEVYVLGEGCPEFDPAFVDVLECREKAYADSSEAFGGELCTDKASVDGLYVQWSDAFLTCGN